MCITGYLNAVVAVYEESLQCVTTQQGHFSASFLEPPETNPPTSASVYALKRQSKADTIE